MSVLKGVWQILFRGVSSDDRRILSEVTHRWKQLSQVDETSLRQQAVEAARRPQPVLIEIFALTAAIAERLLDQRLFDAQLRGALVLQRGGIAEMQTGEGKTLAAVPAIVWLACQRRGVHVLTANDYLARRDAEWMGPVFRSFGLSVGCVEKTSTVEMRRAAYACDITYTTANEVGFDYLRDGLACDPADLVHRPFACAVIDEADSILLDEARIPLVIAGGDFETCDLPFRVHFLVSQLQRGFHFQFDEFARNVHFTDAGIEFLERQLACGNLFLEENLPILTAAQDALHAHALLRRDVDYVVRSGSVELVDEFRGRIAGDRRWPAGLQTAIEVKEGVRIRKQGRVLGSITIQCLIREYAHICGMTGTAATQASELRTVYGLPVTVIPTTRPVVREDLPDVVFPSKLARDRAVVEQVLQLHEAGRPVLIGTASVEASEALSAQLTAAGVPHSVLNARNDEAEAKIIAQAGAPGAVTVSTNMAGRGTDILLGGNPPQDRDQVVALGGLYVLGTTRHEARRIDHQLRGRAGRQGDPGASRFFLSLEDDLLVRFGITTNPDIDSVQRTAEGQNFEIRQTLRKYDLAVEHYRREVHSLRRDILLRLDSDEKLPSLLPEMQEDFQRIEDLAGREAALKAAQGLVLHAIDDLWADCLEAITESRAGIHWSSYSGHNPLHRFVQAVKDIYEDFETRLLEQIETSLAQATVSDNGVIDIPGNPTFTRGATWTYLTTDEPFGTMSERVVRGLKRQLAQRFVR